MFQGFVNKMPVIMKLAAMGPIDIPPWCNVFGALTVSLEANLLIIIPRRFAPSHVCI
jgi:hypothetical protein